MPRLPSFVTRVDAARGVRCEARINTMRSTGKRLPQRKRFASLEEVKAWHFTTTAALSFGTFTAPSEVTVKQAVEAWLKAKSTRVKQTITEAYTAALRPVVDEYGDVPVQKITKQGRHTRPKRSPCLPNSTRSSPRIRPDAGCSTRWTGRPQNVRYGNASCARSTARLICGAGRGQRRRSGTGAVFRGIRLA